MRTQLMRAMVVLTAALVIGLFAAAPAAQATELTVTFTEVNIGCSSTSVSFNFDISLDLFVQVYSITAMETIAGVPVPFESYPEPTKSVILSYPLQEDGTELKVEVFVDFGEGVDLVGVTEPVIVTGCTETAEEAPDDGRMCFEPGETRAAMYPYVDESGVGITIWAINANNEGQQVITLPRSAINNLPAKPEFNTRLARSIAAGVGVTFWHLTDGTFQINVGPDGEGKIHVCVFEGMPPTRIFKTSFVAR